MSTSQCAVYQVKDTPEYRDVRFRSYEKLKSEGRTVQIENYQQVYIGRIQPGETPADIKLRLQKQRPKNFKGHSIGLGLCLHFLLFLLCLLCLLLHEILDVPSGFFIKAVVTVIHNYGTFFTENHIGCSCPILLMFHQKPFLFVHQDIILCKPCPFLSFDFVPGRINGKSGIGRRYRSYE